MFVFMSFYEISFHEILAQFVENLIFPGLDIPSSALLVTIFYEKSKLKNCKESLNRKSKTNLVWGNIL